MTLIHEIINKTFGQWGAFGEDVSRVGAELQGCSGSELTRAVGMNFYLFNRWIDGGVIPAMQSVASMQRDVTESLVDAVRGKKGFPEHLREVNGRLLSAARYEQLVRSMGRELFGSARFDGEELLAENDFFTLTYLPPRPGAPRQQAALFHAGGFLPYSDRIFRFLPECNLFAPFLDRGVPVYALELRGDKDQLPHLGACTLERVIDVIGAMSEVAHRHNGGRPLMLEGYCGLGMPALSYVAARPEEADERFNVAFTMVAPIDGSQCDVLNDMISTIPRQMILANSVIGELFGGYISGDNIRVGMDIPLGAFFHKTPFGRFAAGWRNGQYGGVRAVEDLDAAQRKEMAGAYWISPENSKQFPMPVDLASFASRLWLEAIADEHRIPARYAGRALSLNTIREQTRLRVAGFYGGKDRIVPDSTAHPLQSTLGERYTHVVHAKAGHISYVLSPELWDQGHKYALDPNPLDVVLGLYAQRQAERQPPATAKK